MKPELFKNVVLTQDFPEEGLRAGDAATVIDYVENKANNTTEALLELPRSFNDTFAFVMVPVSAIAPMNTAQPCALNQAV